ncbi:serine hydrolase [Mesoterricola silvestris]|uniref:Peptidase S11 D-alanyl-D-alanine carboxypeptidase A N-terminal domain-containing protein n=1 Tax=Mesoterricola silvestris TaxID=2927979 RepID=A0AA48GR91_9BACT|nr:serine hydrolase [Mesoterricola silvestris]BDU72765.1 hypothetical protein METEAL_19390 [Mesoterricola silvestris]
MTLNPWDPSISFRARRAAATFALLFLGGISLGAKAIQRPALHSASVLVQDQKTGEAILQKHSDEVVPVASLTKLMTAMVLLDSKVDMEERLTILEEDKDLLRHSHSRLPVGTVLTRSQALQLALMASENRAAHALARTYPGGVAAFVAEMNAKARAMGLATAHFEDPTGLSSGNVASAWDMARIVDQAHRHPQVRAFSTRVRTTVDFKHHPIEFHNSNMLLASSRWSIGLSKTGFIDESGQCLVMQAQLAQRPVLIVLLDATGRHSRFDDANRIREWMEGPAPERRERPARARRHRRPRLRVVSHRR